MFFTSKQMELMKLMELHYVHGIDFPFFHQKPKQEPYRITQQKVQKPAPQYRDKRVWRQR